MQRRCDRNRKRSKRRAIYCPIHGCHLNSVSPKYSLYTDRAGQLQQRGISRRNALLLIASQTTVALPGEWLEAFWCDECQKTGWYHVRKQDAADSSKAATYDVSIAPSELWKQVAGVVHPSGNPSVSEFSRKWAKGAKYPHIQEFSFIV